MKQLNSNIVIDASREGLVRLRDLATSGPIAVSSATLVEVLGFHRLTAESKRDLQVFFREATILEIDDRVIDRAIRLRQRRKMSLGDALIAATALVHGLPSVTRNISDFAWVEGLVLFDPGAAS